ncbi:PREDICTED: uncharacterized protein LOC104595912 [Nelumbo nucifera]|uniref:Uncharacterized protein LOC104595912 n=1 Tax=Nelumbo nucifera TaxID=4432 RepID=A0A1U7ZM75_NELNU|nr:PREDICTED: uncharacterized protein LOC104595912 [Nelumbo nucifera]
MEVNRPYLASSVDFLVSVKPETLLDHTHTCHLKRFNVGEEFLVKKRGFAEVKASSLRMELFKTYGSSLAGLRFLDYDIDADDYHGFVHGRLPYEAIKPDPQLRALLRSINQRKIILTNSDRKHAIKVLERIGTNLPCFRRLVCLLSTITSTSSYQCRC